MKFKLSLILLIIYSLHAFGQNDQKASIADSLSVHKIYDTQIIEGLNGPNWAYLMIGKDTVYAHLMNDNIQSIDNVKFPKEKYPYENLMGGILNQKKLTLFFLDPAYESNIRSSQESSLLVMTLDFSTFKSVQKEIKYLNDDDYVLHASGYKNKFYVVSVKKKTSQLKVTIFENDSSYTIQNIFLDHINFSKSGNNVTLFEILIRRGSKNEPRFINKKLQPSLANSSPKNKVYVENDYLYLSLDTETDETKVISFNLNNYKSGVKLYKYDNLYCGKYGRDNKYQTNSYIFMNSLYQAKVCTNGMMLTKHNMETDSMTSYKTNNGSEILFRNTPIVESSDASMYDRAKSNVIDTKSAFYSFYESTLSLYATVYRDTITVTTGAFKEEILGSFPGIGGLAGAVFVSLSANVVASPKQVIYFKSQFDKKFKHVHGNFKEKGVFFDMIDFMEEENERLNVSFGRVIPFYKIMNVKDYYVLAYYNKKNKNLYLKKFESEYIDDDGREKL